ncbi:MAG TPA: hypothetical protein VIE16_08445 [Phenylobacterium sp.]|jgi:hypothetical protein
MADVHTTMTSLALVIEIIGLFLLAREVADGKKIDKLLKDFEEANLLLYLYAAKDYEGFIIASRLNQGDTPEQARRWVVPDGGAVVEKTVEDQWKNLSAQLVASRTRFLDRTPPNAEGRGRLYLWSGTLMLMAAAVIHLVW